MKYRILGKTGLRVSVVGVGTWQFGGEWGHNYTQKEADETIDAAREVGINLIDTAECYGDHLSEKLVGGAVNKDREKWIVATKFGHVFKDFLDRDRDFSPQGVTRQLEKSLHALNTDYIDILQFHSGSDEEFATNGLWEALQKEKEKGKIRHIGLSIGSNQNVHQTKSAPLVGAKTIQVVYNRLDTAPEKEVLPLCLEHNLGVLARVPLASGFLSGKYKPGHAFTGHDVRARRKQEQIDARLKLVSQIAQEEVPQNVSMAQWALAWCLQHEAVTCVIPGCKTPQQVRSNAKAAELPQVTNKHPQAVQ